MDTQNKNYTPYHIHTTLSTGVTNIDSVTHYNEYIDLAKSQGIKSFGFAEHGSAFEWFHKKEYIENAGMKYIHAAEMYLTESYDEKIRDNYHCVLIAKNYEGFKELNKLISKSFYVDHYYYEPRILIDDVVNTSENIIVTTACVGGVFGKGNDAVKEKMLCFAIQNKERVFLEVQHHNTKKQKEYNEFLYYLSKQFCLKLIAGTDTHSLNKDHAKGRLILQQATKTFFPDEDGWDLTFKSYDELVDAFKEQNVLPKEVYLEAIENTNVMASMVEEFTLDRSSKYPKIYNNPKEVLTQKVFDACKNNKYIRDRYTEEEIKKIMLDEIDVYEKTQSLDFMLLENHKKEWEIANGVQRGYGRGSVSGSMVAYALGITEMDSQKFNLNFFRFQNPDRVTNCDIDVDYSEKDRDKVKEFILRDHMNLENLHSCNVITFNTIALKGAIKYVGKALGYSIAVTQEISNAVLTIDGKQVIPDEWKEKYPDIFFYVDIVIDSVISIGTHASGVVVSDLDIEEMFGTCRVKDSPYPASMINMKELDALMYVKLDILGLDNIGVINETCNILGIDRLNPDNMDLNDENVWKSIRDDTTLIFQWESQSAQAYLKKFMSDETIQKVKAINPNFSYIKWFSFGNGLLRPACESYRNDVANGEFYHNGMKELDEFLAQTMGHVTMQEDIMKFLTNFCGYSSAESDTVRRGIAKKYGTEKFLPEIEQRFKNFAKEKYNMPEEESSEIIKPFLKVILDASKYSFSWNHSDSYSCIGYAMGYLRYYYPFEFITAALNVFETKTDKIGNIIRYGKQMGLNIAPIKFRHSRSHYVLDKENKTVYKGLYSVKTMNEQVAEELYAIRDMDFKNFFDLLFYLKDNSSIKINQINNLVKLNFFSEFGNIAYLLKCCELYDKYRKRKDLKIQEIVDLGIDGDVVARFSQKVTAKKFVGVYIPEILNIIAGDSNNYKEPSMGELLYYQDSCQGYIDLRDQSYKYIVYVREIDTRYSPRLSVYTLSKGEEVQLKVQKDVFNKNKIEDGDIIYLNQIAKKKKMIRDGNGSFVELNGTIEWWAMDYKVIDNIKKYK